MSSEFLDDLLAGGPTYTVKRSPDGATFQPIDDSDAALQKFQTVVATIRANDGHGYGVFKAHQSSDRHHNMTDRMLITFDD